MSEKKKALRAEIKQLAAMIALMGSPERTQLEAELERAQRNVARLIAEADERREADVAERQLRRTLVQIAKNARAKMLLDMEAQILAVGAEGSAAQKVIADYLNSHPIRFSTDDD